MGFLMLKPGDTDAEMFEGYSPEQLEWAESHAESLACEVQARFCCYECGQQTDNRPLRSGERKGFKFCDRHKR